MGGREGGGTGGREGTGGLRRRREGGTRGLENHRLNHDSSHTRSYMRYVLIHRPSQFPGSLSERELGND